MALLDEVLGVLVLPKVGGDWTKVADWCRKSDPTYVATCFQSMGRDVAGVAVRDPQQMKSFCAQAGSGEKDCIYGASRDVTRAASSVTPGLSRANAVNPRLPRLFIVCAGAQTAKGTHNSAGRRM